MLRFIGKNFRSSNPKNFTHCAARIFCSSSVDCLKKVEKMAENSSDRITRVLFCGPHWPASQKVYKGIFAKLSVYPGISSNPSSIWLEFMLSSILDCPFDDVPEVIGKYHICVVKNRKMDSKLIAQANQMKLLMQYGVGLEGVDVVAATQHGIKVARMRGNVTGNSASCAEMAIYLMLGLLRKQKEMDIVVKQKGLGEPVGDTLLGKTVFILGFGNIGIDLAKRLKAFGVRILATKRSWASGSPDSSCPNDSSVKSPAVSTQSDGIDGLVDKKGGPENLYDFAKEADIVVACLTMNSETAGIVNTKFLSSMRQGSLLVNVARGGLLDYKAVANHLQSGHLGGLGMDVAWTEPFDPDDPILKFPNVLITPHVAGVTEYSYRSMAQVVGECALQLHAGAPFTGIEFVN